MNVVQRARRLRRKLGPPPQVVEPARNQTLSPEWLAKARAQLDYIEASPEWQGELINEYGFDRAVRAMRANPTPAKAKAVLEAERQTNEALRWANNGRLPFSY